MAWDCAHLHLFGIPQCRRQTCADEVRDRPGMENGDTPPHLLVVHSANQPLVDHLDLIALAHPPTPGCVRYAAGAYFPISTSVALMITVTLSPVLSFSRLSDPSVIAATTLPALTLTSTSAMTVPDLTPTICPLS